jgi:tRNA G18 (ribose-2'-O)-methylase SpoU
MDGSNRNDDGDADAAAEALSAQEPIECAPSVAGHQDTGVDEGAWKVLSSSARRTPTRQLDVHLVIAGIAKRPNVITLLQTAVAFGVRSVLVVGQEKNLSPASLPALLQQLLAMAPNDEGNDEEENDDDDVVRQPAPQSPCLNLVRFRKWKNVVEYLKEREIPLVGVEIHPSAITVSELLETHVDDGDSVDVDAKSDGIRRRALALVMGNEGDGLSQAQMDACRHFVRIPQYGSGTASLNVAVAASVVLHQLHTYQMSLLGDDRETNESDVDVR